jgi:hypothetical protein
MEQERLMTQAELPAQRRGEVAVQRRVHRVRCILALA